MKRTPLRIHKPVILLGAGASKPAGVPTATEMTDRMIGHCAKTSFQSPLRAIIGALQMQQASSRRAIDVEQVMNASALLADRHLLEFAPFVGAWHPIIADLERKRFSRSDAIGIARSAMRSRHIGPGSNSRSGERAATELQVSRAIESALVSFARYFDQRPDGALFRELSAQLTGLLIDIATLKETKRLSYLDPLLELGRRHPVTIATLNYDNSVELRSRELAIECNTGLKEWSKTGLIPSYPKGIQLLKLHGSIDWRWLGVSGRANSLFNDRKITDEPLPPTIENEFAEISDLGKQLAVLFGGHNKLTAEGPFLDLLVKFRGALFDTTSLVVVGYSFRDLHVNHYILRWLQASRFKHLFIVDAPGAKKETHPFFAQHNGSFDKQVWFVPKGAKRGIAELFR